MRYLAGFAVATLIFCMVPAAYAQDKADENRASQKSRQNDNLRLQEEIRSLVSRLGAQEWKTREEAMKKLVEIGEPAIPAMAEAWHSEDIEVKVRAEKFLDRFHWVSPDNIHKIEQLVTLYSRSVDSKKNISPADIDRLLGQLACKDEAAAEEAKIKLVEAGEQVLDKVVKLSKSTDDAIRSSAEVAKMAILQNMQESELKILDGIAKINHSLYYLVKKLAPGNEESERQGRIAEILSGITGLNKPKVSVTTGKIIINGLEFMRPPGAIRVSTLDNGTVQINGVEVPIPGRMKKGISIAELLTGMLSKREVQVEVKTCVVEMIGKIKAKKAVSSLLNAVKNLKPEKNINDKLLLEMVLKTLPLITEGGPSHPTAGEDEKELRKSLQAWQKWYRGSNSETARATQKKKRQAWRRRNR